MEIQNFEPNSHAYKERKEKDDTFESKASKINKVVNGEVKTKKRNGVRKLADVFLPEDVADVKSYILLDVIVPTVKDAILDTVSLMLFGKTTSGKKSSAFSSVSYATPYHDMSKKHKEYSSLNSEGFDYDDIIFANRGDAESVLYELNSLIRRYKFARVGDLYELAGISIDNFTVNDYGWTSLQTARVEHVREGWTIRLPKAMPLD